MNEQVERRLRIEVEVKTNTNLWLTLFVLGALAVLTYVW